MALVWEHLDKKSDRAFFADMSPSSVCRAKVPGGWLIWAINGSGGGITFLPDAKHEWDGSSPQAVQIDTDSAT